MAAVRRPTPIQRGKRCYSPFFPKHTKRFSALPLLGPVTEGFDDWLAANGYTAGSREFSIRFLTHADADLRKRGVRDITKLSQSILYDSWRHLIKDFPNNAGTVRTLARYLNSVGVIKTGPIEKPQSVSSVCSSAMSMHAICSEVRGSARFDDLAPQTRITLLSRASGSRPYRDQRSPTSRYRGIYHASQAAHVSCKSAA